MNTSTATSKKFTYEEFIARAEAQKGTHTKEQLVQELRENIARYEAKYKMTSEEFIPRYERGEFEMDDNFDDGELFSWSGDVCALNKLTENSSR
ncbi:MAG: hypothetical protein HY960_00130 [Ignavibacteriae bacterium]|nr:hypothetical protein [Ignavibacteriota bacterium]